jgi:threonine dehydrogenase-like Zn-dependent dehydrogenase
MAGVEGNKLLAKYAFGMPALKVVASSDAFLKQPGRRPMQEVVRKEKRPVPRELVAIGPRQPVLRECTLPPLGPGMVRVVSEFGSPKHGTELPGYRADDVSVQHKYDPEWRCTFPLPADAPTFPRPLGNTIVGRVAAVGEGVTALAPGDRVYGLLPLRDVHVAPVARLARLPEGMTDEGAVCVNPAYVAVAMRDAHVRLGDRVAVFGLGAIGLIVVQMCRLAGAELVVAVDPLPLRRNAAARLGADVTLDPTQGDVGAELRRLTDKLGVDVALEVSGSPAALHQAVRATRYAGTVGVIATYPGGAAQLYLGQEFHRNATHVVSCRSASEPFRDFGWGSARAQRLAEKLIATGQVRTDSIVQPIVPFEESADAYRQIDEHPETCIKLGVRFCAGPSA